MANAAFAIGIPDYDGTTDPDDFVKAFRKAALMLHWNDEEILAALPDYLKGFAKSAYNKIADTAKDTGAKALKELATACALSKTTHLANFLKRRPIEGESMVTFTRGATKRRPTSSPRDALATAHALHAARH